MVLSAAGVLTTASVVVLTAIALSLLANVMILPVALKVTLLVLTGIVALYFFGRFAVSRLFDGSVDSVAVRLETRYPDLKGRLIAAIQFARMKKNPGYSADLIALTEKQAVERAGLVNFNEVLTFHPLLKTGRLFGIAALLAIIMIAALPGLFSYSYEVYSNPTTEIAPPLGYNVAAIPGSTEWVKYRDIEFGAAVFGDHIPKKVTIHHRMAGGSWQETDIDLSNPRAVKRFESELGDSLHVTMTLRQVTRSFDYYVEVGRERTDVQRVDVVDRPRVTGIKLSIFYPDYTELSPTVIDENNGSFSALVGSRVNMDIETNLPVEQAELIFADSSRQSLSISGKQASTGLVVNQSKSYHIRLQDHLGELNPDPIEYYITAVSDEYPSIEVLCPGFDVNLNDDMVLPLKVRIYDDFGFSSLVLKYFVVSHGNPSEEHVAVLHFSDRIKTEGDIDFAWDLEQLHLYPGDYVVYHFEVADNDRVSGPKITRSRQFVARLPSLDEIIADVEQESAQRINRVEQMYREGKELSDRLKSVARKIKAQDRDMRPADWQHQKELQSIADRNLDLVDKIEKAAREMEKTIDKMMESSLMSREVMEKLQQIQKLFEEVATPEMREAQRRLMEALKRMDPSELQKAMNDFEMSQEELLERLDRTLALLKRMQLEQKMEAMLRKAEQLVEEQKGMNEKTEASEKENLPSLAPSEDNLRSSLEELKQEVSEMMKMAEEAKMESSTEVQQFAGAIKKTEADKNMAGMSQALQQQQKTEAGEEGQEALSKLSEMLGQMQQQLQAMKGGDAEEMMRAMRMAIDDANYLSQQQEELLKEAAAVNPQSVMLREMASVQQDLAASCSGLKNRIAELGKQSPFVAAELQKLVSDAIHNMELATQGFDETRGSPAMRNQHEAMVNLNRAALRLMESLEQQKQCQKGGNCNKNLQKLQSLCNKQNQLNQQTKQCNNPRPGESSSAAQRETLQRLAGEQGAIRKSLEDLNAEFGKSRQILGRLDDIAGEMKEVEEALSEGDAGETTTQRQLRIYSRMLQAARSLQRKDYTEQRRATTAEGEPVYVPPSLPADLFDDRANLEDRLKEFLGDSYPEQYREQIRAYFKALLRLESGGPSQSQPAETSP
ncbi:MAG: DUF4175 family protein [Candidatus Zixiibacteriota bacterium]